MYTIYKSRKLSVPPRELEILRGVSKAKPAN
jgi:hypothetical protein